MLIASSGCFWVSAVAQNVKIDRINPTNWYVGMKNPKLQLMVHGDKIAESVVSINYPGVKLLKTHKVENSNYLFLDLMLAPNTQAGSVSINFTNPNSEKFVYKYELKKRDKKPNHVTPQDLIYLIMPDRFANADPSNDKFDDMADKDADRNNPYLRHGGDLLGVQNKLDYLADLGVTTVWLNPAVENDQPQTDEGGVKRSAYHGYGFTDHYQVDKRLGGNIAYKNLVETAHKKGMKVMYDAVYNHVGINHWFLKDMPMKSWLNQWDTYTNTSYRFEPVLDILHGSKIDFDTQQSGWFVPFLPDLNHKNDFVANFLIQHALWTVEYFGIDAFRIDTYQYNDLAFMNKCNNAILEEYPGMYITGENSITNAIGSAYFVENNLNFPFKSTLPSAHDFVLHGALPDGFSHNLDWGNGFNKLYTVLATDNIYKKPDLNMIFLDNHDVNRFFSVINEDVNKYIQGLGFLLTTRGVPQLYYGTECLTKNFINPSDAEVRKDFEGGWAGDKVNKFVASGRTEKENQVFDFIKKLANFRKKSETLGKGKLMQFLPKDGFYVYFRYTKTATSMVIMSQNKEEKTLETKRFQEMLKGYTSAEEVMSGKKINNLEKLTIPAGSFMLLELKK